MNFKTFLAGLLKLEPRKKYSLMDTFGCPECPPTNCPTFLKRKIHEQFQNAIKSYNIIVVYGESRQGKTWTIERYCPLQLRIGCDANMTVEQIKIEMLHAVGVGIHKIEHSITDEYAEGNTVSCGVGKEMIVSSGMSMNNSAAHTETLTTSYLTVDLSKNAEFLDAIKTGSSGKYFVLDNFHYLPPAIQQQFCTLLKEFNYQGIKVIIVGVWKESSRITALAPDLVNRCAHIDIGSWSEDEFDTVVLRGSHALNIEIDPEAKELFERCSANNIGIFKDFLQKYCQRFNVLNTQNSKKILADNMSTQESASEIVAEVLPPLRDRIINLAMPQRSRRESKHMRLKIVMTILTLIIENDSKYSQSGIALTDMKKRLDFLCEKLAEEKIEISNLTQELGLIHEREENRQTGINFIPLFYFDKTNKKLLILEPTVYVIREYNSDLLRNIIEELENVFVK
ncbi:hypothetical protein [uncultured Oscillibacter sp.]|uniref:hypothetical protein n=1 Tax=uncultured Oscillibacter sp. TaxID=876091 RepID=UPI0025DD8646|nr:hypothetical protein [uncultured Oscillibacter sp.]